MKKLSTFFESLVKASGGLPIVVDGKSQGLALMDPKQYSLRHIVINI